jgi:hypothetical protein
MTIVDNPFVTLWYHPETKIVHHQLHRFITGKEFREFLMAGSDVLAKNGATKWLSDDHSNSVLKQEDIDWGDANWLPQTIKAGWKYWAIVQPEKILAQSAMERLVDRYAKMGITSKFFIDTREAMGWLERQP